MNKCIVKKQRGPAVKSNVFTCQSIRIKNVFSALILILIGLVSGPVIAENQTVEMRTLILSSGFSAEDNTNKDVAINILRGYGIPHEVVTLSDGKGKLVAKTLSLYDSSGNPRYNSIILSTNGLPLKSGSSDSAFSKSQWDELKQFQKKNKIRLVSMQSNPENITGVKRDKSHSDNGSIRLSRLAESLDASLTKAAIAPNNAKTSAAGEIDPSGKNAIPFSYFGKKSEINKGLSGVISVNSEREELHLFYSQVLDESLTSYAFASAWVHWLTRGVYTGKRRVMLGVHVDDVFLTTEIENVKNAPDSVKNYRINAVDLKHFSDQRKGELQDLLKNPDYKIELAFNGEGIPLNGGYSRDPLYLKSRELLRDFYWVSHTYTHADMNNMNYRTAQWELKQNIDVAKVLMKGSEEFFSPNALVTPHISGLFNKDALTAMKHNGIVNVVGDNTLDNLRPANRHEAYFTKDKPHGEPGVLIMPRDASDVDYNLSLPVEIVTRFNKQFKDEGIKFTLKEVYDYEARKWVPQLLNYLQSPYMFHQANLRTFMNNGKRDSLISLWIKRMATGVRQFLELPIVTAKMDDLAKIYLNKMALAKCNASSRWVVENGKIVAIEVSSIHADNNSSCEYTISASEDIFEKLDSKMLAIAKIESYGTDFSTTVLLTKTNNSFRIALKNLVYLTPKD